MKTLQEHYNLIKNGKGNKAQFLKQARQLFPEYINQYLDFNTATNVLKSKQIISEAAGGVVSKGFDIWDWKKILAEEVKAEEKKVSKEVEDYSKNNFDNKDMKNADNINFNEIMKGFYAELKDEKNADKTGDEIKAMVVKNLAKDPLYYTKDGEFGVKGVGYTTEAPGLGEPKEPKGKYKSSGYGDLDTDNKIEKVKANVQDSLSDREAKTSMPRKVKEMEVTPQNSAGVKKMPMPGKEKKIKLQESARYEDGTKIEYEGKKGTIVGITQPGGGPLFYKVKFDNGKEENIASHDKELKKITESKLRSIIKQIIREELEEATYQGPSFNTSGGGGGGEKKAPRAVFLSKEVVSQINDRFPKSIKIVSKEKEASMFVSQLFAVALGALSRGRYSQDNERKKPEAAKLASELIPSLVRSKIKSSLNPKPTDVGGEPMHYVSLKLVPKKDGSGYWIPLKGEFDALVNEELNENQNSPSYMADYIAGGFANYIIPGSEEYTYGPDEEGTYHLEFQLGFDSLDYNTPEEEEEELQKQIGGSSSSGPGQGFSRTNVSYEGEENGKYVFSVHQRGGYDI